MEMLQPRYISEEEYSEMEEVAMERHEYLNGQIREMTGGNNRHAILCTNSATALHAKLKRKNFQVVGSNLRVKIEVTGLQTYPDASVYCRDAKFAGKGDQILLSPVVIVEVLSPGTEKYDRGDKWKHYQKIPSLRDYILVTQSHIWVEHFHRVDEQSWLLKSYHSREQIIVLEFIETEISIADLYDGVELSDVLPLHLSAPTEDE